MSKKESKRLDVWLRESYDLEVFMKLMNVKEYCETRYTVLSRPSEKRVVKLIRDGVLPGLKQGRLYYIDIDAEEQQKGNNLVDKVLTEMGDCNG